MAKNTQQRDLEIIDLYLNHPELSNQDIADKYNISTATVSRVARINNLPRRHGNSGIKLSLDQEKNIIERYSNGESKLSLQNEYHISWDRIQSIIKKYNIQEVSSAKRLNNSLIEDYFTIIDTSDKAYWLGWLISDGSITNQPEKSKFQIELTILQKDEPILHSLSHDLGVKDKIYISNEIYRRFSLGCKKMVQDLEKLGITQNKTYTVTVPTISPSLHNHLIRGLFDGDGGFTVYQRSNGQINQELSFCGNEQVVTWIRDTLIANIPDLKPRPVEQEHSIKRVRWGNKLDIIKIRDYIYKDSNDNHRLARKYNLIYANTEVTNSIAQGELAPQSVVSE